MLAKFVNLPSTTATVQFDLIVIVVAINLVAMLCAAMYYEPNLDTEDSANHSSFANFMQVACYMITTEPRNESVFWFGGHLCEYLLAEPFDDAQYAAATPEYRRQINDPADYKSNNKSLNVFHNHKRAWHLALNNTLTLVLEDDALPGSLYRVEKYVYNLKPNFLLKLHLRYPIVTSTWRYVDRVSGVDLRMCECSYIEALSNAGYVLDSRAAAVLLRHSTPIFNHTDQYIYGIGCSRRFNLYGLSTNVVELSGRPSTHSKPHGVSFKDVWTVVRQVWSAGLSMCAPNADALSS